MRRPHAPFPGRAEGVECEGISLIQSSVERILGLDMQQGLTESIRGIPLSTATARSFQNLSICLFVAKFPTQNPDCYMRQFVNGQAL
jgi:hypothetical protein